MLHTEGIVQVDGLQCVESLIRDQVLRSCVYVQSTMSTNTLALEELTQKKVTGEDFPRLYLTDSQTAGRGRLGRTWSTSDDALTLSLLIENINFDSQASVPISLVAGVATADAIDALLAPVTTQIKWPNDVYIAGKKVAGILVEANQRQPTLAVVGIGINVHTAPFLPEVNAVEAGSLSEFSSRPLSRFDVLDEVVRRFVETASQSVISRLRQKCCLTGQRISLSQAGQPREGYCRGIDESGRLLVDIENERLAIQSGEATQVRRRSG
jgi:BirA family transcriptional regulator, biotin operon repressor / biotin---[acetyl-CoA-carboxylase] ligase